MNADQKKANELIELVTWSVDRILNGQHELTRKKDGSPDVLELGASLGHGMALTTEQIEKVLEKVLPPDKFEALLALKKERTPERLGTLLHMLFKAPEASFALSELKRASWEEILRYIDSYYAQGPYLLRKIGTLIVKEREGFSSPGGAEAETHLEALSPGWLSVFTARKYAAEFNELLPNVVKRATAPEFRLLAASKNVPQSVNRYLLEASRCYLYGVFLACLIVCRSAVEEAVKQRLVEIEMESEVQKDDRLVNLLRLARREGLLDDKRYKMADAIREKARKAVHGKSLPEETECIKCFHETRGVLEHLYGRLQ